MAYSRLIGFCTLLLFLVACAPQPAPGTVPVLLPTAEATRTAVAPTAQPILATEVVSTATPPGQGIVSSTPDALLEWNATATAVVQTVVASGKPRSIAAITSPDGAWKAETLVYDCVKTGMDEGAENAYEVLQITRLADGQKYSAATQLITCGGLGAFGLAGIQWTTDSRFLLFSDTREGAPDGGGFGWHRTLYRFDTTRQQVEPLGPGILSPDGQKVAALNSTPPGLDCNRDALHLAVWDASGQVLSRYPLALRPDGCWEGDFTWSPDSAGLAYVETTCTAPGSCQSSLYQVGLDGDTPQALFKDQPPGFREVTWSEPGTLNLVDANFGQWKYEMDSGELEPE